MLKQLTLWNLISQSLAENIPVMLLYVLQSSGSSPGRQGFAMAVNALGKMEGSVGGGIMEHKFVELAKERLAVINQDSLQPGMMGPIIRKQHHDKIAAINQSGMICSGEQTILLYRVVPEDGSNIEKLISSLCADKNGSLRFSPSGMEFSDEIPDIDCHYTFTSENNWLYLEKTGYKHHLHIIGAGHCALALSRLMQMTDFYVSVYDDRSNLHTMTENNYAHRTLEIDSYRNLLQVIPAGSLNYVVVMTVGYRTDDEAIRALLPLDLRYLGVLGSRTKINKLFDQYRKEGISEEQLRRIHSPIGVQISSETPEEIAISIGAELIAVKNSKTNLMT